ncbi:MAG: hypothetical protein HFJ06_03170 [Lachnospiraceae bacterium]|nr:hypothetical protein [Lachnospiraceae bacterium]
MRSESKNDLRNDLKQKLRITWNQEKTDNEIMALIDNAESYLNHLLGAEIDYSAPGMERLLFLNFCMYAWNDCQDEFEDAYIKDINRVRAVYEVKAYEDQAEKNTESE